MTLRLVADIGGTNTRIALSDDGALRAGTQRSFANDDADSFDSLLQSYLAATGAQPREIAVAVAGPVRGDAARLTNRPWDFDTRSLERLSGAERAVLLNDLSALGHAVPTLPREHLRLIRNGSGQPGGQPQRLVVGLGTGFNVSPVAETSHGVICPAAEAGHISMPGRVTEVLAASGMDAAQYPTVETLFSGRGFAGFCARRLGVAVPDGRRVIDAYARDADARTVVDDYSALLGWLMRDLTLSYMALSGIYIAGGVGRAVTVCAPEACADVLHLPCPIRKEVTPPLWSIEEDSAALHGCARYPF
ncbi:glucokinase [Sulfitobacter sp. HNIBRBA3233]|uniref:glucokinase n=1 Tax=Sulfitobacter marinivivus TaxID=3158558 RepID=UPI0032DE8A6B